MKYLKNFNDLNESNNPFESDFLDQAFIMINKCLKKVARDAWLDENEIQMNQTQMKSVMPEEMIRNGFNYSLLFGDEESFGNLYALELADGNLAFAISNFLVSDVLVIFKNGRFIVTDKDVCDFLKTAYNNEQ